MNWTTTELIDDSKDVTTASISSSHSGLSDSKSEESRVPAHHVTAGEPERAKKKTELIATDVVTAQPKVLQDPMRTSIPICSLQGKTWYERLGLRCIQFIDACGRCLASCGDCCNKQSLDVIASLGHKFKFASNLNGNGSARLIMEEHVDGVANKVECKKEKRATKRKINLENISLPPDQASSSTSIIRAGNIFGTKEIKPMAKMQTGKAKAEALLFEERWPIMQPTVSKLIRQECVSKKEWDDLVVEQEFPEYIKESPALEFFFDKELYDYEEKPKVKNPFEGNTSKLFLEKYIKRFLEKNFQDGMRPGVPVPTQTTIRKLIATINRKANSLSKEERESMYEYLCHSGKFCSFYITKAFRAEEILRRMLEKRGLGADITEALTEDNLQKAVHRLGFEYTVPSLEQVQQTYKNFRIPKTFPSELVVDDYLTQCVLN
ncbi:hypothetical protein QYM36_001727 [Artemia franciscana]|uniref:Uncharacterized protein n=2 Tax=Artemia franciscana TaxID=6661 RepID=A0AA88LG35_ARTSF|nr:hypothetical protein QYM36_001727 [Artemia franciscana]